MRHARRADARSRGAAGTGDFSVTWAVRTYAGGAAALAARMLPNHRMFVDPRWRLTVLLDAESPADQEYGTCLREHSGVDVAYVPLPEYAPALFVGANGRNVRVKPGDSFGYDRQQWDTFFFDTHVPRPPGADPAVDDIIAIGDSDGCVTEFVTPESYLSCADGGGPCRLILNAVGRQERGVQGGEHWWAGDHRALQLPPAQVGHMHDFMWTDIFPVFFWRSTITAAREDIARRMSANRTDGRPPTNGTFRDAYREFNRVHYSQINILANWAIVHEPHRYRLAQYHHRQHARGPAMSPDEDLMPIGAHKTWGYCTNESRHARVGGRATATRRPCRRARALYTQPLRSRFAAVTQPLRRRYAAASQPLRSRFAAVTQPLRRRSQPLRSRYAAAHAQCARQPSPNASAARAQVSTVLLQRAPRRLRRGRGRRVPVARPAHPLRARERLRPRHARRGTGTRAGRDGSGVSQLHSSAGARQAAHRGPVAPSSPGCGECQPRRERRRRRRARRRARARGPGPRGAAARRRVHQVAHQATQGRDALTA